MPFILGMCGFGARNAVRDRITIVSGTPIYSTTTLPPGSLSNTSLRGSGISIRRPFYGNGGINAPTGEFWFHGQYYTNTNHASNNSTLRLGVGVSGTPMFAISLENSTNRLTLRVMGVYRAVAASAAYDLSVDTFYRLHMHVSGYTAGSTVRIYRDGDIATPIVNYTLVAGDAASIGASRPNEFFYVGKSGDGNGHIDDLMAFDPTAGDAVDMARLIEPSIKETVPTGNGAETAWGGSYTDIDDRPFSDSDKIVSTAVGQESTFTFPAVGSDNVYCVQVLSRVTRSGTDAGSRLQCIVRNGGDSANVEDVAPGDGDHIALFYTAPDGTDWSPVSLDASRFGYVSVT